MSGFFGGASAGSYLLDSTGEGDTLINSAAPQTDWEFDLAGALASGRALRIRAAWLFSTDDLSTRFVQYSLSSDLGNVVTVDTQTEGLGLDDYQAVLDVIVLPTTEPLLATGGFTAEFRSSFIAATSEAGTITATRTVLRRPSIGFEPQDVTTFSLIAQLSDALADLESTLLYASAEILRPL